MSEVGKDWSARRVDSTVLAAKTTAQSGETETNCCRALYWSSMALMHSIAVVKIDHVRAGTRKNFRVNPDLPRPHGWRL